MNLKKLFHPYIVSCLTFFIKFKIKYTKNKQFNVFDFIIIRRFLNQIKKNFLIL
jgi:hypothetical protein